MATAIHSSAVSIHHVARRWRWITLVVVSLILGGAIWGTLDTLSGMNSVDPPLATTSLRYQAVVAGALYLIALLCLYCVLRSRVVIDGDTMIVRGLFRTVTLTPATMAGYEYVTPDFSGPQLQVYSKDHAFGVVLAYYERQKTLEAWVQARTYDTKVENLVREDRAIAKDSSLGFRDADREARLASLRGGIAWGNRLIYVAGAVAFVNFLFFEHTLLARAAIAVLVLIPFVFDLAGIVHLGHVRIDHDEATRYPEILTGTLASGFALAILSVLDRGALLDYPAYFRLLAAAMAIKGLVWCMIDRGRLSANGENGAFTRLLTVAGLVVLPAFWVGGALYQVNKHLDESKTQWHRTSIVEMEIASGKGVSYFVEVAPWDDSLAGPIEITLRRAEFLALEPGMDVLVGARDGALGIPWVAAIEPAPAEASAEPPRTPD